MNVFVDFKDLIQSEKRMYETYYLSFLNTKLYMLNTANADCYKKYFYYQALVVTEEDIKKQEEKVQLARKKLQECLKELCL